MSAFVNIKQSVLIILNFVFIVVALKSVYACIHGSNIGGNCGITFTLTVIPLLIVSVLSLLTYCLKYLKQSKMQKLVSILVVTLMWFLAYLFCYLKVRNYL
jgi:heme/copper-type cytochrome/quinol oxidase subunit 2